VLSESDRSILEELGLTYTVLEEPQPSNAWTAVLFSDYELPPGYDRDKTDLLVRLPPGFPDAAPDNFWIDPPITNKRTRAAPPNTASETHHGRSWQFFSRHLTAAHWRPGIDDLRTWLNTIRRTLEQDGV